MAILRNFPGNLSGRIGDKIYRTVNGRTIVSAVPEKREPLNTPEAIVRREKFLFLAKTGSAATQNFIIKSLWAKSYPRNLTAYQKFIKSNYPWVNKDYNIEGMHLLPDGCADFQVSVKNISISNIEILVNLHALTKGQNLSTDIAPKASVQGILLFMNPEAEMEDRFQTFSVSSDDIDSVLDEEMNFIIKPGGLIPVYFEKFPVKKVLLCMVLKSLNGVPINKSTTFSG